MADYSRKSINVVQSQKRFFLKNIRSSLIKSYEILSYKILDQLHLQKNLHAVIAILLFQNIMPPRNEPVRLFSTIHGRAPFPGEATSDLPPPLIFHYETPIFYLHRGPQINYVQ